MGYELGRFPRLGDKGVSMTPHDDFLAGEPEILFVKDIARFLDIHPTTIRRRAWREKNDIPLRKVGGRLCCFKVEFVNWHRGTKI